MSEGQKKCVEHMLNKMSEVVRFRLNVQINSYNRAMDDASNSNIQYLKKQAKKMIKKYSKEIDVFCDMITNKK